MSLINLRRQRETAPHEEQLALPGFSEVKLHLPKETDALYESIARHIKSELHLADLPKDVVMSAVLAAPIEVDVVIGFINGDLEVVSASTTALDILDEALNALEEGRMELGPVGLRPESRGPNGKTKLQRYKLAHPDLVRAVEALTRDQKVDLIIEYIQARESTRGIVPNFLKALAAKHPEKYGEVVTRINKAVAARKAAVAQKMTRGPRP